MIINCLPVEVYRSHYGDCTNGGISSRYLELLVACPDGHIHFDSEKELPLNFCAIREWYGSTHIVPAMVDENGMIKERPGWWMYGGNIGDTSDSRFTALKGHHYPLHIHDRREK